MGDQPERRACSRVDARPNAARLGCGTADDGALAASVIDVSRSGALLIAPGWPGARDEGWLRLESPSRTDRVPFRVARRGEGGRVGVAFDGPEPTELIWAAAVGIGLDHLVGGDAGDGRSRDDWALGT